MFPGLGLDPRIYVPQRVLPFPVQVPPWIDLRQGESLANYARRWAHTLEPSDDLYLGGMSMGGAIALEAASVLRPRPRGVFLIASAYSGQAIAGYVRLVLKLAARAPIQTTRRLLSAAPLLLRMVGRPDRRQRNLLLALARHANLPVLRWGAQALLDWRFRGPRPCPVHQIHGARDFLVPLKNVHPDLVIPDAGHALNVTHAPAVNRFILEKMEGTHHLSPTNHW